MQFQYTKLHFSQLKIIKTAFRRIKLNTILINCFIKQKNNINQVEMTWKLLLLLVLVATACSYIVNSDGNSQKKGNPSGLDFSIYEPDPLLLFSEITGWPLKEVKKQLLEGTGKASFAGAALSSFMLTDESSMSLLRYQGKNFGVFGN